MKYTVAIEDGSDYWRDDEIKEVLENLGFSKIHIVIDTPDGPASLFKEF